MTTEVLFAAAWLAASAILLIALRVFQPRPLLEAPVRRGSLSLATVGGTALLYFGATIMALSVLGPAHPPKQPAAPGVLSLTTASAPAARNSATASATASSRPASRPLATAPAAASHPTAASMRDTIKAQAADAFGKTVAILFALFIVHISIVGGISAWGLQPRRLLPGFLVGLVAFFIVYPLLVASHDLVEAAWSILLRQIPTTQPTIEALKAHPPINLRVAFYLLAGISAPILEELFFRGLLQTTLVGQSWGLTIDAAPDLDYRPSPTHRWLAILITSVIFAGAHGSLDLFPTLFLLSLALGYSYERTGNLYASITLHATFNTLNMLPLLLS